MGCADCHTTDGVNGAAGNAHGSTASEYLLKDASGGAALGTLSGGNYVALPVPPRDELRRRDHRQSHRLRVRLRGRYGSGGNRSSRGQVEHEPVRHRLHGVPRRRPGQRRHGPDPDDGRGVDEGYGQIDGTSSIFTNRRAYRFMNGANLRYYAPGTWASGTDNTCNTLTTVDGFGGCTKHTGAGGIQRDYGRGR